MTQSTIVRTSANARQLVNYYDLPEAWQAEARSNHGIDDDSYDQITYVMPLAKHVAGKHVLYDLSECMRCDDPDFDGIIGVSNSMSIGVKLSDDGESCWFTHLG